MNRLLVVIVNYKTSDLVIQCLDSLRDEIRKIDGAQVIVSDNASGDNSVEILGQHIANMGYSHWCRLLPLERNGGFAYGNNECIRDFQQHHGLPEYVLLLNPDTYIRPGAIESLCHFMDASVEVGIAGSRLEDPDGTAQHSAFRYPSLRTELHGSTRLGLFTRMSKGFQIAHTIQDMNHGTDWVAGASMIIRREVIDRVGLLDSDYFMYFEEVDFCLRARRAGWACWYVPESRVVHLVGQASGITAKDRPAKRRPAYWFASRRRYFLKNHGRLYLLLVNMLWLIGYATWRLRRAVQRKPDTDPPYMLWDFFRYNFLGELSK